MVDFLNDRRRKRCAVFSSAMGLAVSFVLTVFGAIATYDHLVRGIYKPTVLEFPTGAVLAAVPLGSLFLSGQRRHAVSVCYRGEVKNDQVDEYRLVGETLERAASAQNRHHF